VLPWTATISFWPTTGTLDFDDLFDLGSDDLVIESLRQGKLILSTLFHDIDEAGLIRFDPVFDWKMMFDAEDAKVAFATGSGVRTFRIFMRPFEGTAAERFIISFLEV